MTNVFRLQKLNFKVEYLGRIKSTDCLFKISSF